MNIVHIYQHDDAAISRYVCMLPTTFDDAGLGCPDIIHIHGCWHSLNTLATPSTWRKRIILTPHGALQPWALSEHKPQQLLERRLATRAYTLIAMGQQEKEELSKLAWNPRIETVANPLITRTTTPEQLVEEHKRIYQKVVDSYVNEWMSDETRQALRLLLKAGITGDKRWLGAEKVPEAQWRPLWLYAYHEGVADIVAEGIRVTGLQVPTISPSQVECYLPKQYERPVTPMSATITELVRHAIAQPSLCLLACLDRKLRSEDINDERLTDQLEDEELKAPTARLMQLLAETTAFDEGFMPLPPLNDKMTQALRKKLKERLRPWN